MNPGSVLDLAGYNLLNPPLKTGARYEDAAPAVHALDPEIHAHPDNLPPIGAARVGFLQLYNLADMIMSHNYHRLLYFTDRICPALH